jgi:formamidopyrimidine-DNA glycosylase
MPELPEVETIKRQLEKIVIGKKIKRKTIKNVRRRGKLIIFDFSDNSCLVFHLKMTGQLLVNKKPNIYTRVSFSIGNNLLIFNDIRKFGWYKFLKNSKDIEKNLGLEPLEMEKIEFENVLKKHRKSRIKPFLLNQKFIAGIGNIYADEILWRARIKPQRLIKNIKPKEINNLFTSIKEILRLAIKYKGSSINNYVDIFGRKGSFVKYHKVYDKEDEKCPRCKSLIKRIKINSRSSYFCFNCQK